VLLLADSLAPLLASCWRHLSRLSAILAASPRCSPPHNSFPRRKKVGTFAFEIATVNDQFFVTASPALAWQGQLVETFCRFLADCRGVCSTVGELGRKEERSALLQFLSEELHPLWRGTYSEFDFVPLRLASSTQLLHPRAWSGRSSTL